MSKVTIVIPCYNASKYINRCIKSFKRQTYKDFSLIFVDDASKDDTLTILNETKKKHVMDITVLANEYNQGPAFSRNRAIEIANSEFITFCDSDDWYDSDYLAKMVGAVEKNQSDIALCGYKVIDDRGKVEYRKIVDYSQSLSSKQALTLDSDSLCMLIVKTSIMKETLLPNIRNGEDIAIVPLLIAKSNKCVALSDCLYNYYRRKNSASEKPTNQVITSLIESYRYTSKLFPKGFELELEFIGIKNLLYCTLITSFSIEGDALKAIKIISEFEKFYPKWIKNPYLNKLQYYKKIVLYCAYYKQFFLIRLIALLREKRK